MLNTLVRFQHLKHARVGGVQQHHLGLHVIELLHFEYIVMQLQVLAVAMTRYHQAGQHILGIIEPELRNTEPEMPGHADQQHFKQCAEIRRVEHHALHLPGLVDQPAVQLDGFGTALFAHFRRAGRCWRRFNFLTRQHIVHRVIRHSGSRR